MTADVGKPVRVSVAMATHHGARYLQAQLDSLARQTILPHELVVADDASRDGTAELIRSFAAKAPFPVHLHAFPNRVGYRQNFLRAAAACKGDVIAFCDQDDVWRSDKIAAVTDAFGIDDVTLVIHAITIADQDMKAVRPASHEPSHVLHPLGLWPWRLVLGLSLAFRTRLLRWTHLHPQSVDVYHPAQPMAHDQWIVLLGGALGRTAYLDAPLATYRQHAGNLYGWKRLSRLGVALFDMANAADFSHGAMRAADAAAAVFRAMRDDTDAANRPRIDAAAVFYADLASRLARRGAMYDTPSAWQRGRALWDLARHGVYRDGGVSRFGRAALLMDACIGVPFGGSPRLLAAWRRRETD